MIRQLTKYYHSCYQADLRALNLSNYYSNKVSHQILLESTELLSGDLIDFPISTTWSEKVRQKLKVYAKEKNLYLCSFFLLGNIKIAGKDQELMAPLFFHNAAIKKVNDIHFVSIHEDNLITNPSITLYSEDCNEETISAFADAIPKGYFGFDQLYQIHSSLKTHFPNINASPLDAYPKLFTKEEIKAALKQLKKSEFIIVPAMGLALIDKPKGSRGVLNELHQISESFKHSQALSEILGYKATVNKNNNVLITTPLSLNKIQKQIIQSCFNNSLTMAIGPPGTGKSFTVAALAIELMTAGKSVLIASKNAKAGNVIANKIEHDFELNGVVVRATKSDYKKIVQKRIENLLNGIGLHDTDKKQTKNYLKEGTKYQRISEKQIARLKPRMIQEIKRGALLNNPNPSYLDHIRLYFLQGSVLRSPLISKKLYKMISSMEKRHYFFKKYIRSHFNDQLSLALNNNRLLLMDFVKALKARTGVRKERFFDLIKFKDLLNILPIWLVNSADIDRVLPLQKELFDVVIIDEASQCDISSSLPLLQRAKAAVIIGDPKQLRHISFLSKKQNETFFAQNNNDELDLEEYDFRINSILDLCATSLRSQNQVFFLNEHFRSMPDIIQFSNKQFYNGQLKIMSLSPLNKNKKHVFLKNVMGKRVGQGYNIKEADQIINDIKNIVDDQLKLSKELASSIGIISPFRSQVNHLQKKIENVFSLETIEKHNLLVGTPFIFQGEEKDEMFISFVLDDASHHSAFIFLNREDVFNVSITRARKKQSVYVSFDYKKLKSESLLAQYIDSIDNVSSYTEAINKIDTTDEFLNEVYQEILNIKHDQIFIDFEIAGVNIDILVIIEDQTYCIDLIGYPGKYQSAVDINKWLVLDRIGLNSFALAYSSWHYRKKDCVEALHQFLSYSANP